MRNYDEMLNYCGEVCSLCHVKTDVDVYNFVETFMAVTDEANMEEKIAVRSTEKMLLRACVSYLISSNEKIPLTFTNVGNLLRAEGEFGPCESRLDELFDNFMTEHPGKNMASTQFKQTKLNSRSMFNDAIVSLLNRLTVFELMEKENKSG